MMKTYLPQHGGLKATSDAVSFTRYDEALPTYVYPDTRKLSKYIPFDEDLNQYRFKVTGLKRGEWELVVQGITVGSFSAAELAKGLNLAPMPGPWATLAEKVNNLSTEQENIYFTRWRGVGLLNVPKEAQPERRALANKLVVLMKQKEAERRKTVEGDRAWKWVLKPLPAPDGEVAHKS